MRGLRTVGLVGLLVLIVSLMASVAVSAGASAPRKPKPKPTATVSATPTETATTTSPSPTPTTSPTATSSPTVTTSPTPTLSPTASESSSATPEPTPTAPTSDACGAIPPKSDGSSWQCTLAENFDGTVLNRNLWHVQTNTLSGTEAARSCHTDSPANVAVSGGALRLTVLKLAQPVTCNGQPAEYSSGEVSTYWKWSQQYGRFEARIKVTATRSPGLQEAFWLWPDVRYPQTTYWPAAGEIDIVETYSQYPDLAIPFLHYTAWDNWGPIPGVNTAWDCYSARGVWNTWALEWTATRLEIFVNDKSCLLNTSGDVAFQKPFIMAFTQALGVSTNAHTGGAPIPATTEVDYVKVWK